METCSFHPDHAAIEHCEVCSKPLCDLCLWYADDGRRLCASHARAYQNTGGKAHAPETYDEAIQPRELDDSMLPDTSDRAPYRGNSHDVLAAAAATLGVTALAGCMGFAYCLPFLAGILGLVAMMNAKYALDPKRARTLGAIALGVGAAGLIPLLLFAGYFFMMFVLLVYSAASGNVGP
jgi:hypothetical protein